MTEVILEVKDLRTNFKSNVGEFSAVDGVNFTVQKGEILGVVGESGCGKSVTSLSIMRLIPTPPGRIADGSILFNGKDLVTESEKSMRSIRGNQISMIFQEPMTSLNPVYTIGDQLAETVKLHMGLKKKEAKRYAIEMLEKVGIPRPHEIVNDYPHQLSGGMRQRVMIAMAMACNPELIIADEPTTALDVTIQAQILDLMRKLNKQFNTSIMFITHDLGVVAEICERVIVMYAGKIIEEGDVRSIFHNPKHPYTKGLLASIPKFDEKSARLYSIPGNVPTPDSMPKGCRFAPRCEFAFDKCHMEIPEITKVGEGHYARCFLNEEAVR